jgi:hypothetical protein
MPRLLAILLCLNAMILSGRTAGRSPARETIYSWSGQFVIAGTRLAPARAMTYRFDTNWNTLVPAGRQAGGRGAPEELVDAGSADNQMVTLDPTYLAASAERIQQAIYDQLGLVDPHRGTVYITLRSPTTPPLDILVTNIRNSRGGEWDYKLEIPEQVRADHLLRALTHVILLEVANRHRRPELVELPLWLREGMVEHLRATAMKTVFFSQDVRVSDVSRLNEEVAQLKREIEGESLFSLEKLSWPATIKGGPTAERLFRLTSHALVTELLQLPEGGSQLGETIRLLPDYQNWQFAFLRAFQNKFETLLDLEKWWAVATVSLSGVEQRVKPTQDGEQVFRTELDLDRWQRVVSAHLGNSGANEQWSFGESYLQLGEILRVSVERREEDDDEVYREEISVPDLITSMKFSVQKPVIEQLIARLFGLQLHAPAELKGLVRDYRFVLEKYLVDTEETYAPKKMKFSTNISPVVVTRRTLAKLEELDGQRERLRNAPGFDHRPTPGQVAATNTGGPLP